MRWVFLIVYTLVGVVDADDTIRVATLNINAGISSPSNAVAAIKSSDADVVCLQEPNPQMMSNLTNALSGAYIYSKFDSPGHNYWYYIDRLGILSKHPFVAKFIAPTAEGAFGSQLAVVHIGTSDIQILNVHLAPPRLLSLQHPLRSLQEFVDSEGKRVAEIKSLLSLLNPDLPTIIAGDFNTLPVCQTIRTILDQGFTDTHLYDTNTPASNTWNDEIEGVPLSARLDYIFCDSSFIPVTNGVVPCASSDHSLVFTELQTKKGKRQPSPGAYSNKAADDLVENAQE
ncbi:endonuclease/exonuclease/phosphatase family protein [Verrucomicrobiota bacterium]